MGKKKESRKEPSQSHNLAKKTLGCRTAKRKKAGNYCQKTEALTKEKLHEARRARVPKTTVKEDNIPDPPLR